MLRWGFYLYKNGMEEKRKEKYDELNDIDKEVYHGFLPYLLLATDIGIITKKTIPVILNRHKYNKIIASDKEEKKFLNEKYLKKFIGYTVNVNTISDNEFFKRLKKNYQNNLNEKLTKKNISKFEKIE
ncbi:MAG: hypothetical protein KGY67_00320 [Candidatus Thermoplasmatota archaeon]|nr:hypothetical protein [Candidatus Thermoplasmatota archaeon]